MTRVPISSDLEIASRGFVDAANRLPTLYALSDEFNALVALLEDDDTDLELIQQELERLAADIKHKAYGIAVVIQTLENLAELQAAEARRLSAKAKANQAHADRVRAYALEVMQSTPGCERIETGRFTLVVRLNNPSVRIVDEDAIPTDFWRYYAPPPPEVNKLSIMEHWRATGGRSTPTGTTGGEPPPGVEIVRTPRLEVR